MRLLMIGIAFATAACSTTPPNPNPSGSTVKADQRQAVMTQCMKSPERFGFPNTRAQNVDLMTVNPGFAPNVYSHCSRVARHILK